MTGNDQSSRNNQAPSQSTDSLLVKHVVGRFAEGSRISPCGDVEMFSWKKKSGAEGLFLQKQAGRQGYKATAPLILNQGFWRLGAQLRPHNKRIGSGTAKFPPLPRSLDHYRILGNPIRVVRGQRQADHPCVIGVSPNADWPTDQSLKCSDELASAFLLMFSDKSFQFMCICSRFTPESLCFGCDH